MQLVAVSGVQGVRLRAKHGNFGALSGLREVCVVGIGVNLVILHLANEGFVVLLATDLLIE